jgi:hypothetical protein
MSLTKLSLARNRLGTGKSLAFFYNVGMPAYFFSYTIAIPPNLKVHDVVEKTFDTYEEGVEQPSR